MLNPKLILSILGLALAGGLALLGVGIANSGWVMIVLGAILTIAASAFLYVWWRANQLLGVSQAIARQDMGEARRKLDAVRNPEKLNALSKTYYYFLLGSVEVHSNRFKEAKNAFRISLETNRFRAIDERATALVMMAQLELRSRNTEGARRYLREARDLKPGEEIQGQIKEIVKQTRIRL